MPHCFSSIVWQLMPMVFEMQNNCDPNDRRMTSSDCNAVRNLDNKLRWGTANDGHIICHFITYDDIIKFFNL